MKKLFLVLAIFFCFQIFQVNANPEWPVKNKVSKVEIFKKKIKNFKKKHQNRILQSYLQGNDRGKGKDSYKYAPRGQRMF